MELAQMVGSNTSLTHLDISGIELGFEEATWIGDALKTNSILTSISIHGEIDMKTGVIPVFQALERNHTLSQIALWASQKGGFDEDHISTGIDAICTSLKLNKTLLDFSILSPKRKEKIKLGSKSMNIIGEFLKESTLKSFSILSSDEPSDTKFIAEALRLNTTLTSLSLQCNSVDLDSFASALTAPQTRSPLISLHLSHTRDIFFQYFITPTEGWSVGTTCDVLKSCSTLESLDVPVYVDSSEEAETILGLMWHNSKLTNFNINFDRLNSYNRETMKYYKSSGILEDFVVDSRTKLMNDMLSINNSIHYGWVEYREVALGVKDPHSLFFKMDFLLLVVTRLCRVLHLMRKKNHLLVTWWVKEMLRPVS
eukprot:TRINITY_DN8711_c0_g1_i1.p1 TRINITY_DN8711_c0_g1~~TRINITY_DN8711_c0_g1_i1.p1  ORF type:complete len:369 (+),score=79.80 TRINITY_DN8711_c0_g1_i1:307-1413(+)